MIRPVLTSYSCSFSADLKASKVAADGTLVESNRVQESDCQWKMVQLVCNLSLSVSCNFGAQVDLQ